MVQVYFNIWDNNGLDNSRLWDTNDPTYAIVHGWQGTGGNPGNNFTPKEWMSQMAQNLRNLKSNDANILVVDWADAAGNIFYPDAANSVDEVGVQLGEYLVSQNINSNTTLIGHSLGAHVVGEAGEYLAQNGLNVNTIIGLDPAGPSFEDVWPFTVDTGDRLDPSDADRVVALHTSSIYGYDDRIADFDVYVNWDDLFQPGVFGDITGIGNHSYAHTLLKQLYQGDKFLQSSGELFSLSTIEGTATGFLNVDTTSVYSGTILAPGDLAIVSFRFDNPDEFKFVLLTDISSGTVINFTDDGVKSDGSFLGSEGTLTWTADRDYSTGDIIGPTVTGMALSSTGDQIIAYQGSKDNPTFIYALNSEGSGWQSDATDANTSALPPGLISGDTAIAFNEVDNGVYDVSEIDTTSGTAASIRQAIGNPFNWTIEQNDLNSQIQNAFEQLADLVNFSIFG